MSSIMRTIGSMNKLSMDKQLDILRREARERRNAALRARLADDMTAERVLSRFLAMKGLGEPSENALNFV